MRFVRYIAAVKHSLTIILSSILFVTGCFLFKPYYNIGREGCSGLISVIWTALIGIPVFFFSVMVLLTALYRFFKYRQKIELLPFAVIAVLLLAGKGIDLYKDIQDKNAITATDGSEKDGFSSKRLLFRKNGTYTVMIKGVDAGCNWSGRYLQHNDTLKLDEMHSYARDSVVFSAYIQRDAVLLPLNSQQDTSKWFYIYMHGE